MESARKNFTPIHIVYLALGMCIFGLSIFRIHLRLQTTLIGYEIGKIKQKEIELRDKQSELRMLHSKVSTFKHLNLMSHHEEGTLNISGRIAQK